jgi:hypothetical protein
MYKLFFIAILSILGLTACKDKTGKTETTVADPTNSMDTVATGKSETAVAGQTNAKETVMENAKSSSGNTQSGTAMFMGEWEQSYSWFDLNGNGSIDGEEKNMGKEEIGAPVYFKFNKDGRCTYTQQMKFNGFYEVKNEEGHDVLYLSQEIDGKPSQTMRFKYKIVSANDIEMILGLERNLTVVYKPV